MGKSQYLLQAVRYSDIEFCSSFVPSYLKIIKDCFFLLLSRQLNFLLSRANKGWQGRNVFIVVPKHHIEKISLLVSPKNFKFHKIYICNWIICFEYRRIYFHDGRIWKIEVKLCINSHKICFSFHINWSISKLKMWKFVPQKFLSLKISALKFPK